MPNGDLTEYLSKNPGANRIRLVSPPLNHYCINANYPQAIGCSGRPRLSSREAHCTRRSERGKRLFWFAFGCGCANILYQSNVLISRRGRARLTDFGFTSVVRGLNSVLVPELQGCTLRWAAPEVIRGEGRNTQEADIYSFAMVVIEVGPLNSLRLVPDTE